MPQSEGENPSILLTLYYTHRQRKHGEKRFYMNKVEKYLMKQIKEKDIMIDHLHEIIERIQHYQQRYFKEQKFIDIVSQKASIKSFESEGKIKEYIDLGDINNYGSDQPDFNFVADLLGINKSECCDCECDDCFERGNDDAE